MSSRSSAHADLRSGETTEISGRRLNLQNSNSEVGTIMARRHRSRLQPQIQASDEGAGVDNRHRGRLHPKIHARTDGASPVAASYLPDDDDLLREILIRLPPQPSSLPRASAVCKRWRGLVSDHIFHRQFYAHHQKPPLLGAFYHDYKEIMFVPVLDPPNRIYTQCFDFGHYGDGQCFSLLDCRHGRVLIKDLPRSEVVVCDPITGERRCLTIPSELSKSVHHLDAAVLCAAGDHGHVHGGCHLSSYKVVLVSRGASDTQCLACVYSFETGVWGDLISLEAPFQFAYGVRVPATLLGNCLYWLRSDRILKFDFDRQNLAVIMGPPVANDISNRNRVIVKAVDGSLVYAILSYPRFEMWQRNTNSHGVAAWVLWKTIEMQTILGVLTPHEGKYGNLLGFDEDGVVFLCYDESVYMVQLKSMRSRKLNGIHYTMSRYFPFKSFLTPGTTIAGGFNGAEMLHIG